MIITTSKSIANVTPITIPAIWPPDKPLSSTCGVGDGGNTNIILVTVNPLLE